MAVDNLTVGQLREVVAMLCLLPGTPDESLWEVGKPYLIRTVTMTLTGRLVAVTPHELALEDAAWIADTGRFADALLSGEYSEVEPYPAGRVLVGRGAVVDATVISAALPRTQR
jgi:hypothetical protein